MLSPLFLSAADVQDFSGFIVDCRFNLADAQAGERAYLDGHIPGAVFLDLERDLSAPAAAHGGRHPLPATGDFAQTLASAGLQPAVPVLLYDDSAYAFAARCWWMLRALGFDAVHILSGGYSAWLAAGGAVQRGAADVLPCAPPVSPTDWPGCCSRDQIAALQATGGVLVDAREEVRYRGEHEPIDPVAGHIPGAVNLPWQGFSDAAGNFLDEGALRDRWGELLQREALVVYCGSGVSACVNLLSLAVLGRDDALLYGGSWSDWCSYL